MNEEIILKGPVQKTISYAFCLKEKSTFSYSFCFLFNSDV